MIASQTIELTSTMLLVIAVTMKPASTLFMPHPSHGHSGETGKGGNIICESLDAKMDRRTKVKEKVRITLGAMMALIIVGWIAVIAIAATSVI